MICVICEHCQRDRLGKPRPYCVFYQRVIDGDFRERAPRWCDVITDSLARRAGLP